MTATITIEEKAARKVSRRIQRDVEARIKKLPPDVLADLLELCKLLKDDEDDHKAEIAKAITEIIWPDWDIGSVNLDTEEDEAEARKRVAAYRKKVGGMIRKRRIELGLTQEQLAKKAGIPQSHVSRLEVGKHAPTFTTMERIAKALRTKPSQLDPGFPSDG